jgi:hypothetical protein
MFAHKAKKHLTKFENSNGEQICVQVLHAMHVLRLRNWIGAEAQGAFPAKGAAANVQYCAVAMWLREDSFISNWRGKDYRRQSLLRLPLRFC